MKKILTTLFLIFFSGKLKGVMPYRKTYMDLIRLRTSFLYLKGVESCRLLCISLLCMGVCLMLFILSLILFHVVLFLYTPWSNETKMFVGLLFATIYFLIAVAAFFFISSKKEWAKIFHVDSVMDHLVRKASLKEEPHHTKQNDYDEE